VGRRIGRGGSPKTKLDVEIIGVVENSLYEGPREGVRKQVFWPNWGNHGVAFYVRTAQDSDLMYSAIRGAVKKLDASLPVYEMKTLQVQLDETLLTERLIAMLSAGFGGLATLLASIGLYGVMAFVVTRRTREIGVRMAMGAQRGSVLWLVMREVLMLFGIGLAIGVPAAIALGQYVGTQLYGVQPRDPAVAGVSILILTAVAALAGLLPAQHASRIDPLVALRYE
jgi:ABC-type antimicrobial peptide transport system permease subunit